MMRHLRRSIVYAAALSCVMGVAPAMAKEPIALSPSASKTVQDYLAKIGGRFGALAASSDGRKATYYICQARLWKNCDDYELNNRFVSVPSGKLAAKEALARCGGNCVLLYLNEKRMQGYSAQ